MRKFSCLRGCIYACNEDNKVIYDVYKQAGGAGGRCVKLKKHEKWKSRGVELRKVELLFIAQVKVEAAAILAGKKV